MREGQIQCTRARRLNRPWPAMRKPRTRVEPRIAQRRGNPLRPHATQQGVRLARGQVGDIVRRRHTMNVQIAIRTQRHAPD
eukprot:7118186-Pyramimonas_sp.AAC.1